MATKKSETPPKIYQIKVTLLGTAPPIWRRLLVPAGMTLAKLHDALQVAMGWEDCHMHGFRTGRQHFGKSDPADAFMDSSPTVDEGSVRLFSVLGKVGAKAVYTYDFGDGWEHGITVEKVLPPDPGLRYPLCTAGKLHGPPEDCGGVYGYCDLVQAIRDPDHGRHGEMLEWVGEDFDPDAFSIDEVNRGLAHLQRRTEKG